MAEKKRWGCIFLITLATILWFLIGWLLWRLALQSPPSDGDTVLFELFPRQDD